MSATPMDDLILELADLCGVFREYYDVFGNRHETTAETRKAILRALQFPIDSPDDVRQMIHTLRWRAWRDVLEPVQIVLAQEQPVSIPVHLPLAEGDEKDLTLTLVIEDEQGARSARIISGDTAPVLEQQLIENRRYVKMLLTDDRQRPLGYYTIHLTCNHPRPLFPGNRGTLAAASRLIITPDACYLPPQLQEGKAWGLSVNLYALRSRRNWGAGDFGDLKQLVAWAGSQGAGFVGINPLHAIPNAEPFGISPYSPLSRLYRNFLYLDVEQVPDVQESPAAQSLMGEAPFRKTLDALRSSDRVPYEATARLKERVLAAAFDSFYENHYLRGTARGTAFARYRAEEGAALQSFALFCVLDREMRETRNAHAWQQWPPEYRNPRGPAVRAYQEQNEKKILYQIYLQWLIDIQIKEAATSAAGAGMTVGLYHDLAIGAVGGGSDAWNYQATIACGVDVGAPPDDFNPQGQNWGFPPLIPQALREQGYDFFIRTIRRNMQSAGALRIDHALGMFRLFWIPRGLPAGSGTYVSYPAEDLLRIIALESVRNRTMVIAEDLGTIGDDVRAALKRFRMLSTRLFYFERNYPDPSFAVPERYPDMALCAATTHDLPTLTGYWTGRDVASQQRLDILCTDEACSRAVNDRERDKKLLLAALQAQAIIPPHQTVNGDMTPELRRAVYQYLARTPCRLVQVSLDDLLGTPDQQNMPGTVDTYPNWRQKTPLALEEIVAHKEFTDFARIIGTEINRRRARM